MKAIENLDFKHWPTVVLSTTIPLFLLAMHHVLSGTGHLLSGPIATISLGVLIIALGGTKAFERQCVNKSKNKWRFAWTFSWQTTIVCVLGVGIFITGVVLFIEHFQV